MEILDYFKIPEKAQVNQRVYAKDIITALDATGSEKRLLESAIGSIFCKGIINETTSGIWSFEDEQYVYQEIQIFLITLKDNAKVKQVNEELQKVFPNPIVAVYQYGNKYMLSTAMKRLSKTEKGKTVIDTIQTTDWFTLDELHDGLLSKISYQKKNLKDFYQSIDYVISAEYVAKVTGKIPETIDFTIKAKSLTIQQLLEEKNKLLAQEEEESSMQGKMTCHIKIKEIEQKLEILSK